MLNIENLKLKYPGEPGKIFDGINIKINKGEKVLILGPSGCGKSTLLNVLSGIVPELIDLPMKYDALSIDQNAAVIFQDPDSQFCMPKVYEELAFILENRNVPTSEMDILIEAALKRVGLNVDKTNKINQLSGGMKQKLAIAGALLQEADTLFLDEPTAMLDIEATENLWQLLREMWHDRTVVIVEHKVEHVWAYVDRVILMNDKGEIIQEGTPAFIMEHYENLLNTYGVWHPYAWENAPALNIEKYNNTSDDSSLILRDVRIKRNKRVLYEAGSFSVTKGEWIAVTGKNGTGKTSLLESIMQMIPYDGTMTYNEMKLVKVKDAAKHLYLVYQNPEMQFITNSVYEEVHVNYYHQYKNGASHMADELLKLLKLDHVREHHPFELSIGQKRRLSVATALSTEADIILLDEPTFGLDSHNTFQLIELFHERIKRGQSIIMVTHDPEIIKRYPTRIFNVEQGKLHEQEVTAYV